MRRTGTIGIKTESIAGVALGVALAGIGATAEAKALLVSNRPLKAHKIGPKRDTARHVGGRAARGQRTLV